MKTGTLLDCSPGSENPHRWHFCVFSSLVQRKLCPENWFHSGSGGCTSLIPGVGRKVGLSKAAVPASKEGAVGCRSEILQDS